MLNYNESYSIIMQIVYFVSTTYILWTLMINVNCLALEILYIMALYGITLSIVYLGL